jgi:hypothetical protein
MFDLQSQVIQTYPFSSEIVSYNASDTDFSLGSAIIGAPEILIVTM